jgi:hypothetical protein
LTASTSALRRRCQANLFDINNKLADVRECAQVLEWLARELRLSP